MSNLLRIQGVDVEYFLMAGGSPTIIFLNGFRMPFTSWDGIPGSLSRSATVLQYNRFGVGKTYGSDFLHTGLKSVEILMTLLNALELKPPYILVAHSLGGLIANLYSRLYPEGVGALVFVEGTHPDEKAAQSKFKAPVVLRLISEGLKGIEKIFDRYKYSEDETYAETVAELEKHPYFPAVPVRVLSGMQKMPLVPQESFLTHLECQKKLLTLSPLSRQVLAQKSGHFPQITEPELVIEVVEEVLELVRTTQ